MLLTSIVLLSLSSVELSEVCMTILRVYDVFLVGLAHSKRGEQRHNAHHLLPLLLYAMGDICFDRGAPLFPCKVLSLSSSIHRPKTDLQETKEVQLDDEPTPCPGCEKKIVLLFDKNHIPMIFG